MATITLYCADVPELKLGPGDDWNAFLSVPGRIIAFSRGFAEFEESDFPDWQTWVNHPGTPAIEVLPPDSGMVAPGTAGSFVCPECQRAFGKKIALTGHLRSHKPA